MMYKIPMPTGTNGVRLFRLSGQQMALEYQTGTPHIGKMAHDAALGTTTRTLSIRRPDIDRIIAAAVRQVDAEDAMPNVGYAPHSPGVAFNKKVMEDNMNDNNDDADAAMAKVLEFLENIVSPDDLEIVQALFSGAADVDEAREKQATSRRDDDRRTGRQAADAARRRAMSSATEDKYEAMFPHANRLV